MNDLNNLRDQIDELDEQLFDTLVKRFSLVGQVKQLKKDNSLPALDKKRWQEIRNEIARKSEQAGLNSEGITEIYEAIHKYALNHVYED